jgi:hypothetical protein
MARIHQLPRQWQPISTAPADRDLEVCVIDRKGVHALVFPCRRNSGGWINPATNRRVEIEPTHWRLWSSDPDGRATPG